MKTRKPPPLIEFPNTLEYLIQNMDLDTIIPVVHEEMHKESGSGPSGTASSTTATTDGTATKNGTAIKKVTKTVSFADSSKKSDGETTNGTK